MKDKFIIFLYLAVIFILFFACQVEEKPCIKQGWYKDADGDGLGAKNAYFEACEQPVGFVANNNDNNDIPNNGTVSLFPSKGYSTPLTYAHMKTVWSDEFDGTSLNEKDWNYQLGDGCPENCGWGNNELEFYKKENTSIKDGHLIIEARQESAGAKSYTSSRLTTKNKVNIKYGRIDIRAALPKGKGIWPALWMLGKNFPAVKWPNCGEIDIMEMIGGSTNENTVHGTVHWDHNNTHAEYGGKTSLITGIFNDEFHVFSIIWDEKKIVWYLDDKQYHIIDTTPSGLSEFQEEFFFIFNVAVGGNWPGPPDASLILPQRMVVDYIRVFK